MITLAQLGGDLVRFRSRDQQDVEGDLDPLLHVSNVKRKTLSPAQFASISEGNLVRARFRPGAKRRGQGLPVLLSRESSAGGTARARQILSR